MIYTDPKSVTPVILQLLYIHDDSSQEVVAEKTISVVPAHLEVTDPASQTLVYSFSYRLPQKKDGFYVLDTSNTLQLRADMLPSLELALKQNDTSHLLAAPVHVQALE